MWNSHNSNFSPLKFCRSIIFSLFFLIIAIPHKFIFCLWKENVNFKFMIMTTCPPSPPPKKKQQYKTDSTLLEKIQSHPQMSAQKLCFGFSSPHILWKHPPNSQLLWQCFPGRCKHNFLKMFTLSDLANLKSGQECYVSLPLCHFRKYRSMMRNVQIYMYMYTHETN